MERDVSIRADDYTIEYDPDLDAVVFEWQAFVQDDRFRAGAEALRSVCADVDTDRVLVDARAFAEHREADRVWLLEVCVPRLVDAGIRRTAVVHSGSTLQQLDIQTFVEAGEETPGELHFGDDLGAARDWLREG